MRVVVTLMLLTGFVTGIASADEPVKPKFPLSSETTFFTGPLAADGYVDYATVLNERYRRGATPENNAEVLLQQIFGPRRGDPPPEYFAALGIKSLPAEGDYFLPADHFAFETDPINVEDLDSFYAEYNKALDRPWRAAEFPRVAAWLDAGVRHFVWLVQASRRSHYYRPLLPPNNAQDDGLLESLMSESMKLGRDAACALKIRALLRIGEGDYAGTWNDILTCRRLARLIARGPSFLELWQAYSLDVMACSAAHSFVDRAPSSREAVANYLAEWQAIAPFPTLAEKFNYAERLVFIDALRRTSVGYGNILHTFAGDIDKETRDVDEVRDDLLKIDFVPALREGNRWFDRAVAALEIPDRATRRQAVEQLDAEIDAVIEGREGRNIRDFLTKGTQLDAAEIGRFCAARSMPAPRWVLNNSLRIEQYHDNLLIALALAAYEADHGRFPDSLDSLKPRYLPAVPDDRFADKPLIYRRNDDGYRLYSIGENQRDDDGRGYGEGELSHDYDDLRVGVKRGATRKPTVVQP